MGVDRRVTGIDPVEAAVEILDCFGVDADAIADRRGEEALDGVTDLSEGVSAALRGSDGPSVPAVFLRTVIANGPRGIDAPAKYWDSALKIQLENVFADVGATVEITDADGVPIDESATAPEPFRVEITDAEGVTHGVTFEYPDTPLGSDNYAAVVQALQRDLLDGTGFTIVLLAARDRRWRFALVKTPDFEQLQDRYGDRITIGNHEVLGPRQPEAYVPTGPDGDVFVPSWVERSEGNEDRLSVAGVHDGDLPSEETDVDAVLNGLDPDDIAAGDVDEGMAVATDGGIVVGNFEAFVTDLDAVQPLSPDSPHTPEQLTGEGLDGTKTMAVDTTSTEGSDSVDGEREGLDDVFDWIEREVAGETAGVSRRGDEYDDAEDVLAAEVFGTADSDTAEDSGMDGDESQDDESAFDWVDDDHLTSQD